MLYLLLLLLLLLLLIIIIVIISLVVVVVVLATVVLMHTCQLSRFYRDSPDFLLSKPPKIGTSRFSRISAEKYQYFSGSFLCKLRRNFLYRSEPYV